MRCPKCDSDMQYDEQMETFYCEECNHLYTEDELIKPASELYKLTPIMSIPFINILLLKYAKSDEEKQVYTNIVISSMLMGLVYCLLFVLILYNAKDITIDNFRVEARQYLETTVSEFDPRDLKPRTYAFKEVEIGDKPAEDEKVYELNDEVVRLLAGSAITGETLKHIVKQYPSYSYLIQTLATAQKYQDMNYYFCAGHLIREVNTGSTSSGASFYSGDLEGFFTQTADVADFSILEEERTIMYIYESQRFNVTPIYDRYSKVIGLAFVELEV